MRVHHQAAYILLSRPYSETSLIIEVFTKDYGRLALIAKGAKRLKSRLRGILLPFQPILISWSGKGEVPTLIGAEYNKSVNKPSNTIAAEPVENIFIELTGDALICGFYCNELIINLLHRHDPHNKLFDDYDAIIKKLNNAQNNSDRINNWIRDFECSLIKETGYEIDFTMQANSKNPIDKTDHYYFQQNQGFILCAPSHPKAVIGQAILNLSEHNLLNGKSAEMFEVEGKQLMREILTQMLGYKKIVSRDLFFPKSR